MVESSGKNLCIETFEAKWLNFAQMVEKIIKEQETIIGPVALEQARKVSGFKIDWPKHMVILVGDKKAIVEKLVEQYEYLFGQASVEVCKNKDN